MNDDLQVLRPINQDHRKQTKRFLHAFAFFVVIWSTGCALTDLEYSQKLVPARTDGTGKEIVGVWVSKLNSWGASAKSVLLVRPDGTGILRMNGGESVFDWSYAGLGLWHGVPQKDHSTVLASPCSSSFEPEAADSLPTCSERRQQGEFLNCALPRGFSGQSSTDFGLTFRFNGRELLLEIRGGLGPMKLVFVRADDDAAVEEHLRKRGRH